MRFPAGTRLRFAPSLSPSWQAVLVQAEPRAAGWLSRIESAVLTVEKIEPAGCVITARGSTEATVVAEVAAAAQADRFHRLRVRWSEPSGGQVRDLDGFALMLGGDSEVTLAHRTEAGVRPLLKWRYDRDGTVAVTVHTAAVADRVPAMARALLPREVRVGAVVPMGPPGPTDRVLARDRGRT